MADVKNLVELLETNKNIILTGAPGTGKTYLARDIAARMILGKSYNDYNKWTDNEKELFNQHCGFVQFHPSYDYTDFVEGLRPTPDSKFERRDGVFKNFCKIALSDNISEEHRVALGFDEFCKKVETTKEIELKLVTNKVSIKNLGYKVIITKEEAKGTKNKNDNNYEIFLCELIQLSKDKDIKNIDLMSGGSVNSIKKKIGEFTGDRASYYWAALKEIRTKELDSCPYVFIIDEINRGDISKIFGELFFAIDPGYRGEKGRVKTQYQNLVGVQEEDDPFKGEGFYVPENIYIIGTMNDIDRSVESMDFAMRRRFTWIEVTTEESAENMGIKNDSEKYARMTNLNNAIKNMKDVLGEAYQLGGAYFIDKENETPLTHDERWEYKIKPLLKEYLRGVENIDNKLTALKVEYNKTSIQQEQ